MFSAPKNMIYVCSKECKKVSVPGNHSDYLFFALQHYKVTTISANHQFLKHWYIVEHTLRYILIFCPLFALFQHYVHGIFSFLCAENGRYPPKTGISVFRERADIMGKSWTDMLRFFSRFQADFQLTSGWIEPLLVGGYATFSPPSDEEGEWEEKTGRSKSKSRISDSVLDGDSENNEYAEGRDLRSDKHARREGGDANMQHSDHQGRRHLLHVELQTNAV